MPVQCYLREHTISIITLSRVPSAERDTGLLHSHIVTCIHYNYMDQSNTLYTANLFQMMICNESHTKVLLQSARDVLCLNTGVVIAGCWS